MPGSWSGSGGRQRDGRSDAALLAQTSRDPEAFGVFYVRNSRPLLAFFGSRTRDRDVTSELAAETFAAALASVERYDPAKGSPQQWLYGIANNQLKSLWRTSRVSAKARQRLAMRTPPTWRSPTSTLATASSTRRICPSMNCWSCIRPTSTLSASNAPTANGPALRRASR